MTWRWICCDATVSAGEDPEDPRDADEDHPRDREPRGARGCREGNVEDEEAAATEDAEEEDASDDPDADVAGSSICRCHLQTVRIDL